MFPVAPKQSIVENRLSMNCYYYAHPKEFPFEHSFGRWLRNPPPTLSSGSTSQPPSPPGFSQRYVSIWELCQ